MCVCVLFLLLNTQLHQGSFSLMTFLKPVLTFIERSCSVLFLFLLACSVLTSFSFQLKVIFQERGSDFWEGHREKKKTRLF